ncbi:MAG TPA: hypothetical protein VMS98_18205 [Thermoanaerobaculia bacterium]|nr:hypothetical protein [Thermoanaerobaculia bacterium]
MIAILRTHAIVLTDFDVEDVVILAIVAAHAFLAWASAGGWLFLRT